jgi:prepilin-type processing-associated H-X9-DG protein
MTNVPAAVEPSDPPQSPQPPRRKRRWLTWLCIAIVVLFGIAAFILPDLCRAREPANRVKCASNLKQIGSAMLLYANENAGHYPDRFEQLLATQDIGAEVFVCPSSNDEKANGNTLDEIVADLARPHHLSYVYHGKGFTKDAPADVVLATELFENHDRDGLNVLYGDGHVDFINRAAAEKLLAELALGHNPPTTK